MGVSGAFIFGAQMLNFAIPGTGSSGHLGGGLILAVLLGPQAAFLVMASVLGVQALFFADGGLLALGANIFNLAFLPAFVAYPLIYRPLAGKSLSGRRIVLASIVAAIVGIELGSTGVVLQTTLSGVTELPFAAFASVVLPIHLAIGAVEGLATAAVILFVRKVQPDILRRGDGGPSPSGSDVTPLVVALGTAAVIAIVVLASFASTNPDGLEWSIARVTGGAEIESGGSTHETAAQIQERTAVAPGYESKWDAEDTPPANSKNAATSAVGALILVALALIGSLLLRRRRTGHR